MQPPPQPAELSAQTWKKKRLHLAPQPVRTGRAAAMARSPQRLKRLRTANITLVFFTLGHARAALPVPRHSCRPAVQTVVGSVRYDTAHLCHPEAHAPLLFYRTEDGMLVRTGQ